MIGHTNIEHKGVSLIEKYLDKSNIDNPTPEIPTGPPVLTV